MWLELRWILRIQQHQATSSCLPQTGNTVSLRIAEKKKKGLEQCTLFCGFYFKATPFKNQNKQTKTKPKLSMETSFNFEGVPGGSSLRKRHHDCLGLEEPSTSLWRGWTLRSLGSLASGLWEVIPYSGPLVIPQGRHRALEWSVNSVYARLHPSVRSVHCEIVL